MKTFFLKLFFLVVVLFFVEILPAQALTLTPTRQTAVVEPGASQIVKITLTNDEKESIVATGEVEAFRVDEKTNQAIFGAHDEATGWIRISPAQVTLAPGETKEILFTITIPKVVTLSQVHYLGLFASVAPAQAQVGIGSRVGSLLFLYTAGDLQEESHIVDFSSGDDWYTASPANIFLQIQNSGNIHVLPEGRIQVKNWRQQEIATIALNSDNRFLFPSGMLSKEHEVPLRFRDIGKITARLEYVYGVNKHFEIKEMSFWYFPLWIIGSGAVITIIFLTLVVFLVLKIFFRRR